MEAEAARALGAIGTAGEVVWSTAGGADGFGIVFEGPPTEEEAAAGMPITVLELDSRGLAAKSGIVKVGMALLSFNGFTCAGKTKAELIELIGEAIADSNG